MARTTRAVAHKRATSPKYDEGFLVNYGCPRTRQITGARRGRLTPNLAREYMRTHEAIQDVLTEGVLTDVDILQELDELELDIARDEAHRIADEVEDAWVMRHDEDYRYGVYGDRFVDWDAEEAYFDALEAEEARAYEVVRLARAIVRTQLTRISG